MSDNVLWALRPLEPDVGQVACAKHGYRVHTDMIRFWWRPETVWQQILQLESDEERATAVAAYQFLTASQESSYKKFVDMHSKFLRRHRNQLEEKPEHRCLQLPRRALEEEGLECAVWPHLYPRTNMCETYIRQQDVRRQERPANRRRRRAAAAKAAPKAQQRPRSGVTCRGVSVSLACLELCFGTRAELLTVYCTTGLKLGVVYLVLQKLKRFASTISILGNLVHLRWIFSWNKMIQNAHIKIASTWGKANSL